MELSLFEGEVEGGFEKSDKNVDLLSDAAKAAGIPRESVPHGPGEHVAEHVAENPLLPPPTKPKRHHPYAYGGKQGDVWL